MKYQNIIVGSGLNFIAAAEEMLNLGKEVTILDYGNVLEDKNKEIKQQFLNNYDKNKFRKEIEKNKKITKKYTNENLISIWIGLCFSRE